MRLMGITLRALRFVVAVGIGIVMTMQVMSFIELLPGVDAGYYPDGFLQSLALEIGLLVASLLFLLFAGDKSKPYPTRADYASSSSLSSLPGLAQLLVRGFRGLIGVGLGYYAVIASSRFWQAFQDLYINYGASGNRYYYGEGFLLRASLIAATLVIATILVLLTGDRSRPFMRHRQGIGTTGGTDVSTANPVQ